MSQSQIQEQLQQLKQGQAFSHQQLLQASLVELPITQLLDRITTEMNDNPALETDASYDVDDEPGYQDYSDGQEFGDSDDFESRKEREDGSRRSMMRLAIWGAMMTNCLSIMAETPSQRSVRRLFMVRASRFMTS